MSSSPADVAPDWVIESAERLCRDHILAATPCGGGKNNRVYRVRTTASVYALKCYGSAELDDRDRLGHEFYGLQLLKAAGIGRSLPRPIAVDAQARCALYEWIDGQPVAIHDERDVDAVLDLLAAMHQARNTLGAKSAPPATEAVLRPRDLAGQIALRLSRLQAVSAAEPELTSFLEAELLPTAERALAALGALDTETQLDPEYRTLSPSDFGFHNAIRRPDGTLTFIDFEYFGWDDPVKLVSDFLLHPAMQLSAAQRMRFLASSYALYGGDPEFRRRLALCYPLYGIRWTLIILNEFLPALWERRGFAGGGRDWAAAKREQLRKAREQLAALRSWREGQPE